MRREPPAWAASGVLVVVVIAVFASLQNFGPVNAVRRFHLTSERLISEGPNPEIFRELARFSEEQATDPDLRLLGAITARNLGNARSIVMSDRPVDGDVWVAVAYQIPGFPASAIYVVRQDNETRQWKVDARKTLVLLGGRAVR